MLLTPYLCLFFFFFFKQKTAYEITYGDWSSDVCSSDLAPAGPFTCAAGAAANLHGLGMSTAAVGVQSGTLTVNSNDLDTTAKAVLLSGPALGHAVPALA